jgi:hypothetical protein
VRSDGLSRSSTLNDRDFSADVLKPRRNEPEAPSNEPAGSITRWIGDLKAGHTDALQPLWDRYFAALVERARAKMRPYRGSTAASDEEDVALSAFHSLYLGVSQGKFPRLDDRDDLWRLLVHLTACKAVDRHRAKQRMRRGGGKVVKESDLIAAGIDADFEGDPLDRIIGAEPSPEFAAMVAEEYRGRLDELGDQTLRRIAELKLACYGNDEIRQQLNCSLRSVTLKLELIRKIWKARLGAAGQN